MVSPRGFWAATNPAANPVTDNITFEQHNMNRVLAQKGDTSHIAAVLTKHGIFGYNEDNGVFYRVSSTNVLEALPPIRSGLDADKPAENAANNDSWFYATDTNKFYTVIAGVRAEIDLGGTPGLSLSNANPTTINPDDSAEPGTDLQAAHRDHQHAVTTGPPSSISSANEEGSLDEFARRDHGHNHPVGMHIRGGSRQLDGDRLDIDWDPDNYTPDDSITESLHEDELSAHLKGIDNYLARLPYRQYRRTQAQFDAIASKDANTLYVLIG